MLCRAKCQRHQNMSPAGGRLLNMPRSTVACLQNKRNRTTCQEATIIKYCGSPSIQPVMTALKKYTFKKGFLNTYLFTETAYATIRKF
jgi:hypothetical protein